LSKSITNLLGGQIEARYLAKDTRTGGALGEKEGRLSERPLGVINRGGVHLEGEEKETGGMVVTVEHVMDNLSGI